MEEIAKTPYSRILWNSKDVTTDLKEFLSSVSYTDHEEGASDDIDIVLDNGEGLWSNDRYPAEGDTLELFIGYTDKMVSAGLFQIDELTLSGPPIQISIKASSSFITKSLRTRNNKAFEAQTLKQIASYFCTKHGLTLVDETTETITQTTGGISFSFQGKYLCYVAARLRTFIDRDRPGSIFFLKSVRAELHTIATDIQSSFPNYCSPIVNYLSGIDSNGRVTMSNIDYFRGLTAYSTQINTIGIAILGKSSKASIVTTTSSMLSQIYLERKTQEDKTDLQFLAELATEYGFIFAVKGDKLVFTSYYNLDNAPPIKDISVNQIGNFSITEKTYDTYSEGSITKRVVRKNKLIKDVQTDVLNWTANSQVTHGHIENSKQAEIKNKSGLWNKNRFKQSGTLNDLPGDPELVAGINFNLTGLGNASGTYHIVKSSHTISGDGAYTTTLEIRKTGSIPEPKRVPAPAKGKTTFDGNTSDAEETASEGEI